MAQKMKNILLQVLPVTIIATLLVAAIIYAWTEPTVSPPGGNVAAPLNVGNVAQVKEGSLILNSAGSYAAGLTVNRDFYVLNGNVGIGTTTPSGKLDIVGGPLALGGQVGAPGQVLRSQGAGNAPQWANPSALGVSKFGGDGSDGALSTSTGVITLDLGGAAVFIKNYTSISITGTGQLAFINPHVNGTIIILKSQGDVTIICSTAPCIDASGMGAAPATMAQSLESTSALGGVGNNGGGAAGAVIGGAAGSQYAALNRQLYIDSVNKLYFGRNQIFPGSGGSVGGTGANQLATSGIGGTGGRGGGALLIECGGAWNFTVTNGISVAGLNGGNGGNGIPAALGTGASGGGGGSGGRGGQFLALYNIFIANTGTVNVSSGAGGNGGNAAVNGNPNLFRTAGSGAGTAGFIHGNGSTGGDGTWLGNGGNGSLGSGAGGGMFSNTTVWNGGTGGAPDSNSGLKIIAQNNYF